MKQRGAKILVSRTRKEFAAIGETVTILPHRHGPQPQYLQTPRAFPHLPPTAGTDAAPGWLRGLGPGSAGLRDQPSNGALTAQSKATERWGRRATGLRRNATSAGPPVDAARVSLSGGPVH